VGLVVNGTAGGWVVGGVEVGLFSLNSDNTTGHWTTKADPSGKFVFADVNTASGNTYAVGITFQGADYFTDVVNFSANETVKAINLTVYDATEDDSAIRIVNAHTIVFLEAGALQIQEVYVFANMADRTYIGTPDASGGAQRQTLRFSLPAGFADLNLGGDLAAAGIVASGSGFVDTLPVQPGSRQAFYSYRVNVKGGSYNYLRGVDYPTLKYSMLVQGDNVSLQGAGLTSSGTTDMGGTLFTGVAGTDLARGTTLSVSLSNLVSGGQHSSLVRWVLIAAAALVAGVLVVYLVRRKRPAVAVVAEHLPGEDELLAAMADLDDDFENGRIAGDPYRARRTQLKSQLVALVNRSKGATAEG
jgi:hypothetical protein